MKSVDDVLDMSLIQSNSFVLLLFEIAFSNWLLKVLKQPGGPERLQVAEML